MRCLTPKATAVIAAVMASTIAPIPAVPAMKPSLNAPPIAKPDALAAPAYAAPPAIIAPVSAAYSPATIAVLSAAPLALIFVNSFSCVFVIIA